MFTNHQSHQILIFRSQKVVFFMFSMILGMKILGSKFFVVFFSKHLFFLDIPLKFHIFISFQLPSLSLKPPKFIHIHKSSKSSDIDFQVPKSHVFHEFGHENFLGQNFSLTFFVTLIFYQPPTKIAHLSLTSTALFIP